MRPLHYSSLWRRIHWLMLLTVAAAMVLPAPQVDLDVTYADKWVHVLTFGVLGGWAAQLYPPSPALARQGLALFLFGVATEAVQLAIPWRSGDAADLLANTAGLAAGLSLAFTPLGRALQTLEGWLSRSKAR